ncbi:three prime repair exonuclease 2-like [Stylophora pistillata]|nr:three prime repair exonuclease 2-like [Stylophora pistillata]
MSSILFKFSPLFLRIWSSKLPRRRMICDSQFTSFIFLDLETTGLKKPRGITELSMIAVEREHIIESSATKTVPRLLDKFTTCVRPTKEIESGASMISRISEGDLERKKTFDIELGRMVKSFITRQPQPVCLVAHNGDNFDFNILVSHLQTVEITLPGTVYSSDSLKAFRKQHKEAENGGNKEESVEEDVNRKGKRFYSLKHLYSTYVGGEIADAHSAEADAFALLKLVVLKPDILIYLENEARRLFPKDKEIARDPEEPPMSVEEKSASQVQNANSPQLEKGELL